MLGPGAAAARHTRGHCNERTSSVFRTPRCYDQTRPSASRLRRSCAGELEAGGAVELVGDRLDPGGRDGVGVGERRRGRWRRPGRTPRRAAGRRRSRRRRCRAAPGRPSPAARRGPGGSATPATTRRRGAVAPGLELARPRRPGRRTPRSGAGTAATGSRRACRPGDRPRPRRSSRCPRCRRGAAPARRSRRRRSRGRRARAASRRGRPPRRAAAGSGRRPRWPRRSRRPGVSGRWCGRWVTGPRLATKRQAAASSLADALVADGYGGAELLGEQRDAVLLEHPAHPAQRLARAAGPPAARRPGAGRPPGGRRSGPSAAGRG